jgi:SAM-dependent methyltransferase
VTPVTARQDPYWRNQERVFRGGRLEWYGVFPSEDFWGDLWQQRLGDGHLREADRGNLQDLEEVLVRHLDRQGRYLEGGCGMGYWVTALRARGYEIEGVDNSSALVQAVRRVRPDLPIRHGDVLALDVPDGSLDGYLSFGVVEHRRDGPEPFLVEARRVLKPDGCLLLSVPFLCPLRRVKARLGLYRKEPSTDTPFFQYAFNEAELRSILAESGFRVEEVHYQQVQRCLVEEVPAYFELNRMRGARFLKHLVLSVVPPRIAGHLVLLVATPVGCPSEGVAA